MCKEYAVEEALTIIKEKIKVVNPTESELSGWVTHFKNIRQSTRDELANALENKGAFFHRTEAGQISITLEMGRG